MSPGFNIANALAKSAAACGPQHALEDLKGNSVTYTQLNSTTNTIVKTLEKAGIGNGHRVGILSNKTFGFVSAIFGILRTGAAYVPLDPKAPLNRNLYIYQDCALQAIFIENIFLDAFKKDLKEDFSETKINESMTLVAFSTKKKKHKEDLAYILYTSGSTGNPKGVKHSHFSAHAFIKWACETFTITTKDRIASHAPFHFDLSVFDLFATIKSGATMVLIDERTAVNPLSLAEHLSKKHITIFYATPSVLSYLAVYGKMYKYSYDHLRLVLFAGEVFPMNNLRRFKSIIPATRMYNLYGPTETNVCTSLRIPDNVPEHKKEPFPIGRPCSFANFMIVRQPSHRLNEGELWIGGDSLMNGYWNDEEKTNQAFETDDDGNLWYRTGDVVTLNSDSNIVYLRRNDRMVKRNSFRIELDEIEKHLCRYKPVFEVAVTASGENNQTGTVITAHVVCHNDTEPSAMELMNYCQTVMPSYMIPDHFRFLDALPKTSTDKVNYIALSTT